MEFKTFRLAEDNSRCGHRLPLGPSRIQDHINYGHCQDCRHEVAIELDKDLKRTARTWLVEYEPPVEFA